MICSVDRAKEMGMDWWRHNQYFQPDRQAEDAAAQRALVVRAPTRAPAQNNLTKEIRRDENPSEACCAHENPGPGARRPPHPGAPGLW